MLRHTDRAKRRIVTARSIAEMRMIEALLRWFSPFRLMKDVSRGTRESVLPRTGITG